MNMNEDGHVEKINPKRRRMQNCQSENKVRKNYGQMLRRDIK
jgi:hypothetical protein